MFVLTCVNIFEAPVYVCTCICMPKVDIRHSATFIWRWGLSLDFTASQFSYQGYSACSSGFLSFPPECLDEGQTTTPPRLPCLGYCPQTHMASISPGELSLLLFQSLLRSLCLFYFLCFGVNPDLSTSYCCILPSLFKILIYLSTQICIMSSAHTYRKGTSQSFLKGVQLRPTNRRVRGSQETLEPISKGENIMAVR